MRIGVSAVLLAAALGCGCGGGGAAPGSGGSTSSSAASTGSGGGAAGGGAGPYAGPPIPWDYTPFPAVVDPKDNPTAAAKVELGELLFYDPILSSDSTVACSTCHSGAWGLGDGIALGVGVGGVGPVGPGRTGPNVTTRNAISLWNAAFRTELFWDGRSPSLEAQAIEPMKHDNEMAQPAAEGIARVRKVAAYEKLFAATFPGDAEPVTVANLTRALGAFERTFVTNRAPYDQYVAGDAPAMADAEKRGMKVFASSNCASCHVPPLFEDPTRYEKRFESEDPGRFAVTSAPRDRGAFRVPSLRNLRDTEPYFHDGSIYKMEDAIQAELDREVAAKRATPLSATDFEDLVAFLHSSLEDMTNKPSRPAHVPSGLPVPLDADDIRR